MLVVDQDQCPCYGTLFSTRKQGIRALKGGSLFWDGAVRTRAAWKPALFCANAFCQLCSGELPSLRTLPEMPPTVGTTVGPFLMGTALLDSTFYAAKGGGGDPSTRIMRHDNSTHLSFCGARCQPLRKEFTQWMWYSHPSQAHTHRQPRQHGYRIDVADPLYSSGRWGGGPFCCCQALHFSFFHHTQVWHSDHPGFVNIL